jgi:arabinofuranan 3-O-arabinosyltransferase
MKSPLDKPLLPDEWRVPLQWLVWVILWGLCLSVAVEKINHARGEFANRPSNGEEAQRPDGNNGHAMIDFGGQFIMGRMLVTGHGREVYHRQVQWPVVWQAFPTRDEPISSRELAFPQALRPEKLQSQQLPHDAESLMSWVMGKDAKQWPEAVTTATLPMLSTNPFMATALTYEAQNQLTPELVMKLNTPAIGGPLYPPVHGLMYAPLAATNEAALAYKLFQYATLLLTFFAGYGIMKFSDGQIPWSVATLAIFLFPGYRSGIDLGQNQVLTLAILVWGWVAVTQKREFLAGCLWGLLAFKPVWAAAFLMVPLVMGRWRMLFSMCSMGALLIVITLPFVGLQAWFDWLEVGRNASALYDVNENWINLSRDLSGLVRRFAVDFSLPQEERNSPLLKVLCLALWLGVLGTTCVVYWYTASRKKCLGRGAGFLMLGAYLCCYRFMYYDAVIAVFPLAVLLSQWRQTLGTVHMMSASTTSKPVFVHVNSILWPLVLLLYLVENYLMTMAIEGSFTVGFFGSPPTNIGGMPGQAPKVSINTTIYHAVDTYLLLLIWGVTGVRLLLSGDATQPVESHADVTLAHQTLADENRLDAGGS